jgi:radical SAM superfamily enzyme YgiQ (UPF0313 family)
LKFVSKKASFPPLGLLTVAALLPAGWEKRLVDMSVQPLRDTDLAWADLVCLSAISVQKPYVKRVIKRCNEAAVKLVAGGPLFTTGYEEFEGVDHFVLNEAEITLPLFLDDLARGRAKKIYTTDRMTGLDATPLPLRGLLNMKKYASMNVQYSRGCPFNCDFCDITLLYGRETRTKSVAQVLAELDDLYRRGWRASVFFVDDNFIGNRRKLKEEVLPAIRHWSKAHGYPFTFNTQVSINIADDEELMRSMALAGFTTVFVGIETPHEASLTECAKAQNRQRDLVACVRKIQSFGLEVQAGFIVGFDSDPQSIFERQIEFIQKSGVVTAMVGLLNALNGTKLYLRLKQENRIVTDYSGDNTDCSINFIPRMDRDTLINGYKTILSTIYAPRHYYSRVLQFMKQYRPVGKQISRIRFVHLWACFKSMVVLGIVGKERWQYWKLFFWTLFRKPRLFPQAITFSIYGFHYRKVFEKYF